MRKRVWVLTRYVEEEPGHPVVYRPIVSFDKGFIDQKYADFVAKKEQRISLVWGCKMTQHLVEVPNSEGRK